MIIINHFLNKIYLNYIIKMELFNIVLYPYLILQSVIIPIYLGKIKYIDKENIISNTMFIIISIISLYILINLFIIRKISGSLLLSFIYVILIITIFYENRFEFKNYSENERNITILMIISSILCIINFILLVLKVGAAFRRGS